MSSLTDNFKLCPNCDSIYSSNERICQTCNCDLILYSNSDSSEQKKINENKIKYNTVKNRMQRYRKERDEYRQQIDELLIKIDELSDLPQQINELKERISELENKLSDIISQQNLDLSANSSDNLAEYEDNLLQEEKLPENDLDTEEIEYLNNDQLQTNNEEERDLIRQYYHNTQNLAQHASKVTPTKKSLEDIYLNRANEIIFEVSNQCDYLIFKLHTGNYCLLPEFNFKINTNIKTLKTIFDLQEYKDDNMCKQFKILKPAYVQEIDAQKWQLTERGILKF